MAKHPKSKRRTIAKSRPRAVRAAPAPRAARPKRSKPKKNHSSAMVNYVADVGHRIGKNLGTYATSFIDKIVGSGDYNILGPHGATYNGTDFQAPSFSQKNVRVRHREFVSDVYSSTDFSNLVFPINPGDALLFPWLSEFSQCYEQYRVHGMVFSFKSTSADALNSTNTALGTVVAVVNYDVSDTPFTSKLAMEQYINAVSCKPSCSMISAFEAKKSQNPLNIYLVRHGALPSGTDPFKYDCGEFNLATVGMQQANVTIGELWVSYDIEFLKPKLGSNFGEHSKFSRFSSDYSVLGVGTPQYGTCSASSPFGANYLINAARLPIPGSTLTRADGLSGSVWIGDDGSSIVRRVNITNPGTFMFFYAQHGVAAVSVMYTVNTPSGCQMQQSFRSWPSTLTGIGNNYNYTNMYGGNVTMSSTFCIKATQSNAYFEFSSATGTFSNSWDLYVFQVPDNLGEDFQHSLTNEIRIRMLEARLERLLAADEESDFEEEKKIDMSESTVLARALSKMTRC